MMQYDKTTPVLIRGNWMSSFIDVIMLTLFVFFMVFIFAGYHKTKSEQREKDKKS